MNYEGYQKVSAKTVIPIAGGENENIRFGFRDLLEIKANEKIYAAFQHPVQLNEDGTVSPSQAPGVGLDINRDVLKDYKVAEAYVSPSSGTSYRYRAAC